MPTYITTGLTGGGTTSHFQVAYDSALSTAVGRDLANSLIPHLDGDLTLIQSWFGVGLTAGFSTPIQLHLNAGGGGGADWWPPPTSPTLLEIFPDGGTTLNIARMIVAAEVAEMYEWSMPGRPWWGSPNEGRHGEALSQFAATEVLVQQGLAAGTPTNYSSGLFWFPTSRTDYINSNDPAGGGRDAPTGCAVLFLSYLKYQLGYSLPAIIAAAPTPNLADTYRTLSGRTDDPFPAFKAFLVAQYPGTSSPATSVLGDNPWPIRAGTPTAWQMGVSAAIGDMALVERHPYAGTAISSYHWVEGWTLSASLRDGTATTTFNVSRADPIPDGGYWKLGVSKFGVDTTLTW